MRLILKTKLPRMQNAIKRISLMALCFLFSITIFAQSAQKVTIKVNNINLKDFFKKLEQQLNYTFVYRDLILDDNADVTVDATNKSLDEVLKQVLALKGLDYKITNNTIVLVKDEKAESNKSTKKKTVNGIVTDKEGEPLIGVRVAIEGTTNGTLTDLDGKYTLEVSEESKLSYSYIGFLKHEINVKAQKSFNIMLTEDEQLLDEVVVVGYGTVKKKDHTGSLGSIDSDKLRETNKTSVGAALQGKMAGVDIVKSNNKPGAGFDIMVRGQNKIVTTPSADNTTALNNINPPLYVVDGMFVESISDISPDDIDRIDVLKDASSTAIYGSRGANGVVIISTKRGFEGKSFVEYNGSMSFGRAMNQPDFMNAENYAKYRVERYKGENYQNPNISVDLQKILGDQAYKNYVNKKDMDWINEIYDTSISQSHTARVYGNAKDLAYTFGTSYTNEDGVIGIDDYKRYNVSASVDKRINRLFKAGANIYTAYGITTNSGQEVFRSAYRLNPLTDMYNTDQTLKLYPDDLNKNVANPLLEIEDTNIEKKQIHVFGNLYLEFNPLKWAKFTTTFTPDITFTRNGEYRGKDTKSSKGDQNQTRAYYLTDNLVKYTWDNLINIDRQINDNHKFNIMLGSSWYKTVYEKSNMRADGFAIDDFGWNNMGGGTMKEMGTGYIQDQIISYFSRINYNHKDKYLLTLTARSDGSSRLAAGKRWKFFPSAALGWRVSEEKFLKEKFSALSDLKLRLSYGVSGNNAVPAYSSIVNIKTENYSFGNALALGAYLTNMGNNNLTWETTKEVNLGIDFSFLKSRISGTADLYNRRTDGLLMYVTFSPINGYPGRMENVGAVDNRGIELSVNTVNVQTKDFNWNTTFNFTTNYNEIVELNNGETENKAQGWFVGESIGAIYTYKHIGFWQEDEAKDPKNAGYAPIAGAPKYLDKNNDGYYSDDDDKMVIGSMFPKWTGGITNSFKYKNVDLSFFISTRQGQWSHSQFHKSFAMGDSQFFNVLNLNYWTPENTNGTWFRPGSIQTSNLSSPFPLYYMKTSFVKINYINLGFNLPAKTLKHWGVSKLRVYGSLQNPFIFTNYEGWDPETASENSYTQSAMVRSMMFGLNLTF